MMVKLRNLGRGAYVVVALALVGAAILPGLMQHVSAAQVTSRSIKMSDSSPGGTSASYNVNFTPATTVAAGGGIVVDICDNDPIVGDTSCTFPTGFDWGGATPTLTLNSGMGSGWTAAGVQGGAGSGKSQVLELTSSTGTLTAATPASFTISSVTNPTTANHSFYARIVTFDTAAHMTAQYTVSTTTRASSFANEVDYGGIAMSTAATITITAKVQEQLSFCVYTGANCAAGGTAVALGDSHGVLSSSNNYVDNSTKYDVSTNAQSGMILRMKGATLTSGSNNITAIGASATSSSAGTAQFGLCSYISSGSGVTVTSPYAGGTGNCSSTTSGASGDGGAQFALDTNGTTGTTSTYGMQLASSSGAIATNTGHVAYIANIPTSQAAGIYTTTFTFIATGTF